MGFRADHENVKREIIRNVGMYLSSCIFQIKIVYWFNGDMTKTEYIFLNYITHVDGAIHNFCYGC